MTAADPREQTPFWGYADLLLLCGALIPSILLAVGILLAVTRAGSVDLTRAGAAILVQFAAYLFLFLGLYAIFRFRYRRPFWPSLGWTGNGALIGQALAAGPLLALIIGGLGQLLRTPDINVPMMEMLDTPTAIALIGFFAVTLGPLCEELLFRGFLMPLLARSVGATGAILLASAPFALLHGPQYGWSWRHVLLIGAAGAAFGWLRHKSGSTAASTAMHATYNLAFFIGFLYSEGEKLPKW